MEPLGTSERSKRPTVHRRAVSFRHTPNSISVLDTSTRPGRQVQHERRNPNAPAIVLASNSWLSKAKISRGERQQPEVSSGGELPGRRVAQQRCGRPMFGSPPPALSSASAATSERRWNGPLAHHHRNSPAASSPRGWLRSLSADARNPPWDPPRPEQRPRASGEPDCSFLTPLRTARHRSRINTVQTAETRSHTRGSPAGRRHPTRTSTTSRRTRRPLCRSGTTPGQGSIPTPACTSR